MKVGTYLIENKLDADDRLDAQLANLDAGTMDRIIKDADSYIRDETVKKYYLDEAARRLIALGRSDLLGD